MDIEVLKDKINITEKTNPFLDMKELKIDLINNLSNQKVWLRILNDDQTFSEEICIIKKYIEDTNMVEVNSKIGNKNFKYESIIGIEELTTNHNETNIDFDSYIEKPIRITNYKDNTIECIIQYIGEDTIDFALRIPEYETLSYDLEYPMNLIKKIELI